MKKAYLLAYDDGLGTTEDVKGLLNSMDEVIRWRYDMPHSFYIISESSANDLAYRLRELSGERGRFIFSELTGNEQGWLTSQSWYLINNKTYKPKS